MYVHKNIIHIHGNDKHTVNGKYPNEKTSNAPFLEHTQQTELNVMLPSALGKEKHGWQGKTTFSLNEKKKLT